MSKSKFVLKTDANRPSFNIRTALGRNETKGDVGIEIEVEGKRLPCVNGKFGIDPPWTYHIDQSLRGSENGEYVLDGPQAFSDVPKLISNLWDSFEKCKSEFDDSNRTSVHVHLNCQEFHINRLTSFLAMWFALEEPLTEFCGEARVGNLFCLRAVDSPAIIGYLKKINRTDGQVPIPEILHYAGLNPQALHKYGSIEVRTMRGTSDKQLIIDWVSILERLHTLSADFPDPREVVSRFSSGGPFSYFEFLLGDKAELVRKSIDWTDNQLSQAMFRGIRFAQDLCYCRDWDAFKAMELKKDPFGRDTRRVMQSVVQQPMAAASVPSPDPYMATLDALISNSDTFAGSMSAAEAWWDANGNQG